MSEASTLFLRHLTLCTTDFDAWLKLLHEDIVFDFPYAESVGNPRIIRGKDAVVIAVKAFFQQVPALAFINPTIYPSADPHEGFATYEADTLVPATGRRYAQNYFAHFRERDGLLSFVSEYYDPTRLMNAFTSSSAM